MSPDREPTVIELSRRQAEFQRRIETRLHSVEQAIIAFALAGLIVGYFLTLISIH
jgi:hypothetical protein